MVTSIGGTSALSLQSIADMRNQLDDLQRQLGSGQKTTTYSGLGLDAGLTIGLRSQLNSITGYQSTINQVGVRLDLMQTALSQFTSVSGQAQGTILQSQYQLCRRHPDAGPAEHREHARLAPRHAQHRSGRPLPVLRPQLSTSRRSHSPTISSMAPAPRPGSRRSSTSAGRPISARAVSAASWSGAPSATATSLTEDSVSPFGFKLAGVTTAIAGATVTAPAGAPASMSVDLGATNPNPGDTVKFSFTLPDGSTQDLTLTATAASPPGAGQFTIGASSAVTATNLQAALTQGLGTLANTQLVAASAVQAGNDFFNTDATHPPQRVGGPSFDTATTLVDGTANTVAWYTGDNATDDPRSTALARADQSLTVSYGARANEQGLRVAVQSLAVFAATQFSGSDPNGQAQYAR